MITSAVDESAFVTGTQLVVNDYWQAAIEAGAHHLHLGQEDLAAADPGQQADRLAGVVDEEPDLKVLADEAIALELDEGCAETVRAVHSSLTGTDPNARQRSASVAEADDIIRDHQRRP